MHLWQILSYFAKLCLEICLQLAKTTRIDKKKKEKR